MNVLKTQLSAFMKAIAVFCVRIFCACGLISNICFTLFLLMLYILFLLLMGGVLSFFFFFFREGNTTEILQDRFASFFEQNSTFEFIYFFTHALVH